MELILNRDEILEDLKDGKSIVIVKEDEEVYYTTINVIYLGLLPDEYIFYFDSYDYEEFDTDDDVIDFLKDACTIIEEVKVKII